MSHKQTPYTTNFPPSEGYASPPAYEQPGSTHPTAPPPHAGYPQSMPMPASQPGFQPHVVSIQPGYPPQGSASPQPGYPHPEGVPMIQPGFQPGYAPGYPHPSGPVVQQPSSQHAPGGWMATPKGLNNCPPGLEYLSLIDQLLVRQQVELLEAFVGFETNNKYAIKNVLGQKVYFAAEDTDCCTRNMCGPLRPFDMKIMDNFGNEVIHLYRPLACSTCCFPCCLQTMEVSSPPGTLIGTVEQQWSLCAPSFAIKNATGDVVLQIEGPVCTTSFCGGDVKFKVLSKDGETKVGYIKKTWSGLGREAFTDADYFGINFPMDLDVRVKAVLLGACFLIDFMFFEKTEH